VKYKVWSNSTAHLWQFESLKAEIKAQLIDYKTTGNLINFVIYEAADPVEPKVFKRHKFKYKVMK